MAVTGARKPSGEKPAGVNVPPAYQRRTAAARLWEGVSGQVVRLIAAGFSLVCIWTTLFSTAMPEVRLNVFLALVLVIGYLHYPIRRVHLVRPPEGQKARFRIVTAINRIEPNTIPVVDIVLLLMGVIPLLYFATHAEPIIKLALKVTSPRNPDHVFYICLAVSALLSMAELCRRCVGLPILCVVGLLLIYALSTVRPGKVIYDLFYSTGEGLRGTPIDVCAKYIVVFVIFGAFLERTGISAFFIDLANCIAGAAAGGPAKVAVISSGLCGMVSGSSVGNTVTTGSVTIPMMIKAGYLPHFAGAVEAAASTGGQLMPPIMGAAAFLLAEYMGMPYAQVALVAILPAVLYFAGIYIAVHLEARRLGLKGISREGLPRFTELLPRSYLLLPLVILVGLVAGSVYTMQTSATLAIGAAVAVGILNPRVKLTLSTVIDALASGGRSTITVASACGMAGLVAGCITTTGLASELVTAIVGISGGYALPALVLTMLCCIVLGMGVPTTANYCIMASICAPILITPQIGIPALCAHFFVFYFGIVADITPPVALAAYAGSAIACAPPMRTAFTATRLAIAAFIVPYVFAFNPIMLLEGLKPIIEVENAGPVLTWILTAADTALLCISALLGIFCVAAALNGFLFRDIHPLLRLLLCGAGLMLLMPGNLTDVAGFALMLAVVFLQLRAVAFGV